MGFLSRRRRAGSPMTLAMAGEGSDTLVHAGGTATVVVVVGGEDDGGSERIAVYLRMLGWDNKRAFRRPLGELPATLGRHELEVRIPTELAPVCVRFTEYSFCADLKRTAGLGVTAACDVDIVARPEDLYWPDGPRGEGAVTLDQDVVAIGGTLSGRAPAGVESVEVGPALDRYVGFPGRTAPPRFKAAATAPVAGGAFRVTIPDDVPPTLYDGNEMAIVWEVRAGDAWHRFGVVDPEARAGRRDGRSPELLGFLANLAGDRLFS